MTSEAIRESAAVGDSDRGDSDRAASDHGDSAGAHLLSQLRAVAALAVAAAVFWFVGWAALQPIDPLGPISLLAVSSRVGAAMMMAALAVVASGLSILIAGREAWLFGPLGVGVGLAVLSLRGGASAAVGGYLTHDGPGGPVWPTGGFIAELWVWLAVVGVGAATGRWGAGRLCPFDGVPLDGGDPASAGVGHEPGPMYRLFGSVVLTALLSYLLVTGLGGNAVDDVQKQQVYFAVGAALLISSFAACFAFRPRAAWWPLVAVGLLATAAYLAGEPQAVTSDVASAYVALRTVRSIAARPLPIEYASMGAIGGLMGIWAAWTYGAAILRKPTSA